MILIKNFKSQRWQTLLNFNTQRRLLLTGTPLQNNLMELWSLMHFLMPHVFRSRKEFSYWFSNPLSNMVEGNRDVNSDLITRLHSIMRPFLLRRLKKDVAKQLPGKFEHVVMVTLSKRQQQLYEEFMARSTTRALLGGGNFMGMMNVLMQLRKVCNHPDLFEPRPISSPFILERITYSPGYLVCRALERGPLEDLRHSGTCLALWRTSDDPVVIGQLASLKVSKAAFLAADDWSLPAKDKGSGVSNLPVAMRLLSVMQARHQVQRDRNFGISDRRVSGAAIAFPVRMLKRFSIPTLMERAQRAKHCPRERLSWTLPPSLTCMIKDVPDVARDSSFLVKEFVFVLPPAITAGVQLVTSRPNTAAQHAEQLAMAEAKPLFAKAIAPFYDAKIRQRIFFPDRKLVQYDSGKLQTLCTLLRERKAGGHKCLIFTQMSKMLDILEIFLNLNGHSYVRLDGSTGVEKRQKLMDRFNSDPKLFCFILSTRSGGLGINLTGADTVIFYDSDWNPAMDAQAQDRAHRIGQTREVPVPTPNPSSNPDPNPNPNAVPNVLLLCCFAAYSHAMP